MINHSSDNERIEFAFREAVSHLPDHHQSQILVDLLSESRSFFAANPEAGKELLSVGMAPVGNDQPPTEDGVLDYHLSCYPQHE